MKFNLGKSRDLKLGEVWPLLISHNITIFLLYLLKGFRFILLLRDSENDIFNNSKLAQLLF